MYKKLLMAVVLLAMTAGQSLAMHGLNLVLGSTLPKMEIAGLIASGDYAKLGLAAKEGPVELDTIGDEGDLLMLEFFNQYCLSCRRQAPEMQKFMESLGGTDLEGKVHILAIGIGTRDKRLLNFREELGVTYPIAADPHFDIYYSLGDPDGTPLSIFMRKEAGEWRVADAHLGPQGELELLARSRVLIENRQGELEGFAQPISKPGKSDYLTVAQRIDFAAKVLARASGAKVTARLTDAKEREIYEALDEKGKSTGLYAIISSREPICDMCHSILFALAFDKEGRVQAFYPIYVTKFGNEVWNEDDVTYMVTRLVNRGGVDLEFNSEVDAVSSATMSSILIFDEARRAGAEVSKIMLEDD